MIPTHENPYQPPEITDDSPEGINDPETALEILRLSIASFLAGLFALAGSAFGFGILFSPVAVFLARRSIAMIHVNRLGSQYVNLARCGTLFGWIGGLISLGMLGYLFLPVIGRVAFRFF